MIPLSELISPYNSYINIEIKDEIKLESYDNEINDNMILENSDSEN